MKDRQLLDDSGETRKKTGNLRHGLSVGDPYGAASDVDLYADCGDVRAVLRPSSPRGDVTGCYYYDHPPPATSPARPHHHQSVFLHGRPIAELPQPRGKHVL